MAASQWGLPRPCAGQVGAIVSSLRQEDPTAVFWTGDAKGERVVIVTGRAGCSDWCSSAEEVSWRCELCPPPVSPARPDIGLAMRGDEC